MQDCRVTAEIKFTHGDTQQEARLDTGWMSMNEFIVLIVGINNSLPRLPLKHVKEGHE
jgi:hypothetical protein